MTLQQLRYLIAVAEAGSINSVAKSHFIAQSAISTAIKSLEEETGVTIFIRSNRGIELTAEGVELVGYARQVVEQADLMERRYAADSSERPERLSIASQHYAFVVRAFVRYVSAHQSRRRARPIDFTLRETRTADVIDDVAGMRSDVGVLYLSTYNERVLRARFDDAGLRFSSLFRARPHVFVREGHPLASRESVGPKDLEGYVRYGFEQGPEASLFLSEEPLATLPCKSRITVSDRATMTSLLRSYDGYLVSTGVRSDEMLEGIVAVPVDVDEVMNVGYVVSRERRQSPLAQGFVRELRRTVTSIEGDSAVELTDEEA